MTELTKREVLPTAPVRELWLFIGRRSGKSIIAALQAVWATCCRSYRLAVGEVGIFMVLAADRKQARVIKRYISGLLHSHPALEALIANETADAIELTNGLTIEIHTCSYRSLRGYTCIGAAVDEVAFWQSEDSANPDREVLLALRAAMASQPEAMLVGLTTTYARRGEVWRIYEQHFGNDGSADVLVVNGPTRALNPTISQRIIDAAYEEDPIAAAAEFGGEFRRDVETYLSREALDAVVMSGRLEQPPAATHHYVAFVDAAGGSGKEAISEFPKWHKYLISLSFLDKSSVRPVQVGGFEANIVVHRSTAVRGRGGPPPPWESSCRTRTGPVEADGTVDAQNAPTAPWKTLRVFHELPQGLSHRITHAKPRKAPKWRWETRIDPEKTR